MGGSNPLKLAANFLIKSSSPLEWQNLPIFSTKSFKPSNLQDVCKTIIIPSNPWEVCKSICILPNLWDGGAYMDGSTPLKSAVNTLNNKLVVIKLFLCTSFRIKKFQQKIWYVITKYQCSITQTTKCVVARYCNVTKSLGWHIWTAQPPLKIALNLLVKSFSPL